MTTVIPRLPLPRYHPSMKLLADLTAEHVLIERVAGSLRTFADRLQRGEAPIEDVAAFLDFFVNYADSFHHDREEDLLIPALENAAGLPARRGPIAVILDDHERMAAMLAAMRASTDPAEINRLATTYSQSLWLHIDVENSVLFPESESQLRVNGVQELPSREATAAELAAAATGETLIVRYPPMQPDIIRGDGCVMCHAYGDTCRGLEREWWNDWTWEELDEHIAAG